MRAKGRSSSQLMYAWQSLLLDCMLLDCKLEAMFCACTQAVDTIDWPEGFARRDIGWRAVKRMQ